jgi:YbgC/YbaW family acyl-CoA thioester hydrolase
MNSQSAIPGPRIPQSAIRNPQCEFKVTRRVEFSDTDMEGIMHFSNFFRFMEPAEHAFLRSLGYSAVLSRNGLSVCLPRVHAECDFLAPLRFEDEVQIHLLVQRKGTRSLTYQFRFHRLNGSAPAEVARGLVTVVCAARQSNGTFKAVALPKALAERIQEAPASALADRQGPAFAQKLRPGKQKTKDRGPRERFQGKS